MDTGAPILEPGIIQGIAITALLNRPPSSIILYNIIIVTVALKTFITQERANLINVELIPLTMALVGKTLSMALT